jgi:hypothetical protein
MASVADLVDEPRFQELTDPLTYEEGVDLADQGAVAFDEFGPLRVRARVVDGDAVYVVDLRSGLGKLTWSCSEPGGARAALCRHLVAAGVETSRRAPARAPGTAPEQGAAPEPEATPFVETGAATPAIDEEGPGPAPIDAPVPGAVPISGVHAIVFTPGAAEVRTFLADVLGLASVEAADGWPIFALPPAELAVHPDATAHHELWLRCDDLEVTLHALELHGVRVSRPVRNEAWGRVSEIHLPGGARIAIYQPTHPGPLRGSARGGG